MVPSGDRVDLFVRKSLEGDGTFVLEEADGSEQEGPPQDIACKYVTADHKLMMDGYQRMVFHGNGKYPHSHL
jgi:hypothetical protein